jgi:hypothetical protein
MARHLQAVGISIPCGGSDGTLSAKRSSGGEERYNGKQKGVWFHDVIIPYRRM